MFLENLFGSVFGMVWLIVFLVAILFLLVWLLVKKENVNVTVEIEEEVEIDENKKETESVEKEVSEEKVEICEEIESELLNSAYEIIGSEDDFFRVKKVGTDRTLRKFNTKVEAENFIREKEGVSEKMVEVTEERPRVYEIEKSEDGFFRVKKVGTNRTLRKFATEAEAESFVKEKENI